MTTGLTIGGVSRETGCNIETIRYYERIGLLSDPPRSAGGHRLYNPEHVKRLTFIRRGRQLGFTLDQVRQLLSLVDGGVFTCEDVQRIALAHLDEVREKIADLERLEIALSSMAEQCSGGQVPECPVIDALFAGSIAQQ